MFARILKAGAFAGLLFGSLLTLTACQSTGKEKPEALTGQVDSSRGTPHYVAGAKGFNWGHIEYSSQSE